MGEDKDRAGRLEAAHRLLDLLGHPEIRLETARGGLWVVWPGHRQRWSTRGQSFYPPWHRKMGVGGTMITALSQLVRFVRGQPVVGLGDWRHWTSPTVRLGRVDPQVMEAALLECGWPHPPKCVLCGAELPENHDWWDLQEGRRRTSGPCCRHFQGCRQQGGTG